MAESSITVCVRIRPFSAKEQPLLAPTDTYMPFLGDGGLSGGSPAKPYDDHHHHTTSPLTHTGPSHLRPKLLRSIVTPVDDKVLIFDPPDNNPLTRLLSSPVYAPGAKRHKDIRYAFDRIFDHTCGQNDVFEGSMKPLLDGVLDGFNASVFAYGATGCGKTHTISGTPEDPGVIFLTMKELYQRIADKADECDVDIRLSYLEIYNETIRDLLSTHPTPAGQGLALREDSTNKISVVGITEHIPASPQAVLELLAEGNKRRTMSPTEANAVSSRSHAVLQINVTQRPRTADTMTETTSASLNIIDLAGSERAAATRNNGARMKEGANINKSLLALGNCINALCVSDGRGKHVPYRNSKLTRLLKFSLGGNCRTTMIVCVSPSSAHYEETHNTLKYANQAKNIRTKISRNLLNVDRHVAQYVQAIHELKEEVAELKAKLADRGMLESAGMKRRRAEVRREVEEAKRRMTENVENVRRMIAERAVAEAELDGASVHLVPARLRLAEIDEALQREAELARAAPADLVNERELLRAMILSPAERRLADVQLVNAQRSMENSVHAAQGCIVAAANNSKFQPPPPPAALPVIPTAEGGIADAAVVPHYDPDAGPEKPAAEEVRSVGARLFAELERDRFEALYRASMSGREADARKMCAMSSVVARMHAVLGEVAAGLAAGSVGEEEDAGAKEEKKKNDELVRQLRDVMAHNERSFEELAGIRLELSLPAPASVGNGGLLAASAMRSSAAANGAASALPAALAGPVRGRASHSRRGRASLLGAPRAVVAIPAPIEEITASPLSPSAPASVATFQGSASALPRFTSTSARPASSRLHSQIAEASKDRDVANSSTASSGLPASAVPAYMRATASSNAQARNRRSSLSNHTVSRMTRTGRLSNLGSIHAHAAHAHADPGGPSSPRPGSAALGPGVAPSAPASSRSGPAAGVTSTRRVVSKTMSGSGRNGARGASGAQQAVPPSPRRGGPASAAQAKKAKSFRWADEAGEGCLDDQGKGMLRFASGPLVIDAAGARTETPTLELSSSSPPSSPTKSIAPVRRRLTGLHPPAELALSSADADLSMNSTASTTEWEDVQPAAGSASAPSTAAAANVLPPVKGMGPARRSGRSSMAAVAGSRGGMFNKAFLANSKSSGRHSLNEDENDAENSSSSPSEAASRRRSSGGLRDPLGELGGNSSAVLSAPDVNTDDFLLSDMDLMKTIAAQVPDSTLKSAPYRRESSMGSGAGGNGGSIGPVRRKRRSSAGVSLVLNSSTSSSTASPSPPSGVATPTGSNPFTAPASASARVGMERPLLGHAPTHAAARSLSSPRRTVSRSAGTGAAAAVAALAKANKT
ncbi:hypothetical protein V8E36_001600 [Tilletia maclaganii]